MDVFVLLRSKVKERRFGSDLVMSASSDQGSFEALGDVSSDFSGWMVRDIVCLAASGFRRMVCRKRPN